MAVVDDLGHPGMDVPPPSEEFGRQPPQDLAAEQAVLGGMLLSKDAIADVIERLRPADFYKPAHQNIYDAALDLYGRGEPVDAVTVAAELDRRGLLRRIGGAPYLHTLISTVPTAANAGYYAGIVAEKALLRRLLAKDVPNREGIEASVVDLGEHPDDEDFQAAVRAQVKKALAADAGLLSELAGMVKDAGGAAIALGERSVAAQTLSGIVVTGDNTTIQR